MKPTVSLRLQQTKAATHPIQVSIGFGIKHQGKYLQLYKSTGISLPRNHWDDLKNLPIDSGHHAGFDQLHQRPTH